MDVVGLRETHRGGMQGSDSGFIRYGGESKRNQVSLFGFWPLTEVTGLSPGAMAGKGLEGFDPHRQCTPWGP